MHVIEDFHDLCSVEASEVCVEALELFQQVEQLPELHVLFQHVEVVLVLVDALEPANEVVMYLTHVLEFVVDVLLLLGLEHLPLGYDFQCAKLVSSDLKCICLFQRLSFG